MRIDFAPSAGRRRGRIAGLMAAATVALSLAGAASASAFEGTATLAPIGTGSYLVTVTNTGTEKIQYVSLVGENVTNVASGGFCTPQAGAVLCEVEILPKAAKQICYSGSAIESVYLGLISLVHTTAAPAVATCPVSGFTPASGGGGGGAATGGSGGSTGGARRRQSTSSRCLRRPGAERQEAGCGQDQAESGRLHARQGQGQKDQIGQGQQAEPRSGQDARLGREGERHGQVGRGLVGPSWESHRPAAVVSNMNPGHYLGIQGGGSA